MRKWVSIILGVVLIVIQGINICFTANIYNKLSDSSNNAEKVQEVNFINYESPVMNVDQAANYVGVTAEQLLKMIKIEMDELNRTHSFSGEMIPYFKVNDELLFYRNQLDVWLHYISIEKVEYNLVEGYRFD